MNPSVSKKNYSYEHIKPGYYDEVFRRKKGVQSEWHQMKFERIRKEAGSFKRLLDVGCGPGTFIGTLTGSSMAIGIDVASVQIAYASEKYGSNSRYFLQAKAKNLPFGNESFDTITSIEVIEHLPEDQIYFLFEDAYRVLKPKGNIIITTPNYASLWPIIEIMVNKLGEVSYDDQHITHFNRKRLHSILKYTGFSNISISSFLFISPFLSQINEKLPRYFSKLESKPLCSSMGLLLIAKGSK